MEVNIAQSSVDDLEKELSSAKRSLITLNDNIRRLVGRGLKESRFLFNNISGKMYEFLYVYIHIYIFFLDWKSIMPIS